MLWAKEYYQKSADEISTELVFLKIGATKPYAFYEEQLRDVQEMISREFAAMNASYEYGNFPVRPSKRQCISCRFAEFCPESKSQNELVKIQDNFRVFQKNQLNS